MAHGVPETDVFQAADAVLARGERPTVERVRGELGRGSPARVGHLLEQWWEQLAQRLKGYAWLPELPGEAAQAFADVWRAALAQAEATVRAALTAEQNALFAAQTELTQERKLWEIALDEAQAQVADATTRAAQTEVQLRERQTLVAQLDAQRTDLLQQRNRLQAQLDQQRTDLETSHAERVTMQNHIRVVEDRAHQQIDQARQELKAMQQRFDREQREHGQRVFDLTEQNHELQRVLRAAEQAAAHQAGRVVALEAALAKWQSRTLPTKRTSSKALPPTKAKSAKHQRKTVR